MTNSIGGHGGALITRVKWGPGDDSSSRLDAVSSNPRPSVPAEGLDIEIAEKTSYETEPNPSQQ